MKKIYFLLFAVFAITFSVNAQELINDGSFDEYAGTMEGRTESEWGMWSDDGGTVVVEDNVAVVTPGAANEAEPWHLQLEQWNEDIFNDVTYVIKFEAMADAERIIQVTLEDPANSYNLLGETADETSIDGRSKWNVPITTEMTEYVLTTTIDAIEDNTTVKFAFLLGTTTDVVYIDNVSMMEEGAETSVAVTEAASVKVYPNPASSTISVQSSGEFDAVRILNVAGQVTMSANNASTIDVAGLKAGVYFVELMQNNSTVARSQFVKQ